MPIDRPEASVLEFLDGLLSQDRVRQALDMVAERVERRLKQAPMEAMSWEPVALTTYGVELPDSIRSSWVFVLRANTVSGAERHANSRQRMMSYRGRGDFQTQNDLNDKWMSHRLVSDLDVPSHHRWISIPPNVWHQAVVGKSNWVVVSFHTVSQNELIEERPDTNDATATRQRRYVDIDAKRKLARDVAAELLNQGKPLDWFEKLYRQANGDESVVPWADMTVNPNLAAWLERKSITGKGRTALVVGCGLGDDAEALASLGFQVTAFDISAACIQRCRRRFPNSPAEYSDADLFSPPTSWQRAFDFVWEAYTLQVFPDDLRTKAIHQIAEFVAPDGTLLVVSRGRSEGDDAGKMPRPLLQNELAEFCSCGLREVKFEDYLDDEDPPVRRFRIEYRRRS